MSEQNRELVCHTFEAAWNRVGFASFNECFAAELPGLMRQMGFGPTPEQTA